MAVDTKEKRLSFLNAYLPWWTTLPEADGTIDQDDRQHLLGLYAGILAGEAAAGMVGVEAALPRSRPEARIMGGRAEAALPRSQPYARVQAED
jgi:hypothetical protein